jgi:hypothetical protein
MSETLRKLKSVYNAVAKRMTDEEKGIYDEAYKEEYDKALKENIKEKARTDAKRKAKNRFE